MTTKRSIAILVSEGSTPERWLLVRRPPDDEDLPNVWGLPAGTREPGESEESLVARIGREKLGVELAPGRPLVRGAADRGGYGLEMRLWDATIIAGTPQTGGGPDEVTQYADWAWKAPTELAAGAKKGSLCCALGLELHASRQP